MEIKEKFLKVGEHEGELATFKVAHYHPKMMGLTWDEVPIDDRDPRWRTDYTIEANSPKEAAVIAHGLYNGFSLDQLADDPYSVNRTEKERIWDEVEFAANRDDGKSVFYANLAPWIVVWKDDGKEADYEVFEKTEEIPHLEDDDIIPNTIWRSRMGYGDYRLYGTFRHGCEGQILRDGKWEMLFKCETFTEASEKLSKEYGVF